jgi:hypothetical protein
VNQQHWQDNNMLRKIYEPKKGEDDEENYTM